MVVNLLQFYETIRSAIPSLASVIYEIITLQHFFAFSVKICEFLSKAVGVNRIHRTQNSLDYSLILQNSSLQKLLFHTKLLARKN